MRLEKRSLLSLPRPKLEENSLFNPLQFLQSSQLGSRVNRKPVFNSIYKKVHLLRRTIGHLSAVFCLLFDKTGNYVFTGADDLLVKMWGTFNGRLYFTFRGASAEISDMAVSEDNKLLAAGSTDKIIRVWCLQTAAPVAVLAKHTGAITALHFCPASLPSVPPYLAATSGDGTVSFWKYTYKSEKSARPVFDPEPTRYHEKMRPGDAQMICASFSFGGLFFATGSADNHVRVYMMDGKEGPVKVLEQEAHTKRVDSLQWANKPNLRFASGSKDGTARIWSYKAGEWHSVQLVIKAEDGRTVHYNTYKKCEEPLRVTMTTWTCDDRLVITAVSDASLHAWDSQTSELLYRLKGHKDEVYVLEPHPTHPDILLSGAHDGSIIIWEISTKQILYKYNNNIEGQGFGAIYDAKWCPDQLHVAASDSHGHVIFLGVTSPEIYKKCPEEMFFHSDYRPLLRDSAHHVVDEQSQCAPHLLPPPFLVDSDGNPYPADIQRLVPGREHLSDQELLVPNLTEVESPSPNRRRRSSEAVQRQDRVTTPASNIDQLIAELAATTPREGELDVSGDVLNPVYEHSYASPDRRPPSSRDHSRPGIVLPAPSSAELTGSIWRKRNLIPSSHYTSATSDFMRRKEMGHQERIFYKVQLGLKKTSKSLGLESRHQGIEKILGTKKPGGRGGRVRNRNPAPGRSRAREQPPPPAPENTGEDEDDPDDTQEDDYQHDSSGSETSLDESDLESGDSSSSSSTEYSDWGANNLTPPKRTARKSGRAGGVGSKSASSDEGTSRDREPVQPGQPQPGPSTSKPGPSRSAKMNKKKNYSFNPTQLDDIPPEYLPSDWLAQYVPNKSPYFPQMGDEVMYIKQGHIGYINLVKNRNSYRLNMREQQWLQREDIKDVELVKVIGMKHEIRPPRLCCLKLAIMDPEANELTGDNFSIKYHDMNDVVDFLVLRHNYETSIQVKWKPGDRYRCQIEDSWWFGTVVEVSPFNMSIPESPFLSIKCSWDSGEEERLSPWDLDPVQEGDPGYEKMIKSMPVTRDEIERFLYQPLEEEWRGLNSKTECIRISAGLEQVMVLAIAEPFNYPVDLTQYPDYMLEIEYPIDFSLIKSRLDNQFYRRITAVQFDVRYIATNTECYNRPKTDIVKNARILTDLVLRIIQDPELEDINREYHRLVDNFKWEDTQEPKATKPSGRAVKSRKKSASESPVNPKQWKHDCNELLHQLLENPDSEPFREPVSEIDFPDYSRIITTPMDLSQVRESLRVGEYRNPHEFRDDVELVFINSMKYNTDKKSLVVKMTKRLKLDFQDRFQAVIKDWRNMNRRLGMLKKQGKSPSATPKKKKVQGKGRKQRYEEEESDEEDPGEGTSKPNHRRRRPIKYDESFNEENSEEEDEEDEEDEEVHRPRRSTKKPERFREENSDSEPRPTKERRRLNLDLSETSETDSKSKGKGKSTKALSRRPKTNSEQTSSNRSRSALAQEDTQSSEESEQVKKSTKKGRSGGKKSSKNSDESESDDDIPISVRRNITPKKKSINGKGVKNAGSKTRGKDSEEELETEELTEEEEDIESTPNTSESEEYDQKRKDPSKSSRKGKKRKHSDDEESQALPRPRRQATARAISKFQESNSDDDDTEPLGRRRDRKKQGVHIQPAANRRKQRVKSAEETVTISAADSSTDPRISSTRRQEHNTETESEEELRGSRVKRQILRPDYSEENEPRASGSQRGRRKEVPSKSKKNSGEHSAESNRSKRRTVRPDYSEDLLDETNGSYQYEDEDVNPRRKKNRNGNSVKLKIYEDEDASEIREARGEPSKRLVSRAEPEQEETTGRTGRKIVKPARLQDYSNDELIREARRKSMKKKRKTWEDDSDHQASRKKRNEGGSGKRNRKEVRYTEESEPENRKSKGRRKLENEPNYRDHSETEDDEEEIRPRKRGKLVSANPPISEESEDEEPLRKRGRTSVLQHKSQEDSESEEEEEIPKKKSGRNPNSNSRSRLNPRDERQDESSRGNDNDSEESDYGKRKRPRRQTSGHLKGESSRPQRSAGQSGRSRYRESSDEDPHPKRHHRGKISRTVQEEASDGSSEETEDTSLLTGISSRVA
ncbi:bromodomain and WD repeat-containing protein 3 isoform X10 [Eurytemora carolleeae]|uniref:bromodomain and WD repeat-containing protein 3 isoform X10 n=1 Tax=Eurytemora carolleeae TaxID=1294199 RepID=UPI000C76BC95|nr:bromodomain and WD repeat-containing protein 3 isoform X10 [Eurytemora carolleeae]|eukprot:XP_023331466.1 bromodomain and WD repeat-containing protein 3-like isoform X10 [Eurytemora affinis]